MDLDRIETLLAKAVRRYLIEPDETFYPAVSTGLERLLGWHWKERRLIPPKAFDGVVRPILKVVSPDELSVLGLMVTLASQNVEWFSANVVLEPDREEMKSYILRHGIVGMRPVPYESMDHLTYQGAVESAPSWNWAQVFQKP